MELTEIIKRRYSTRDYSSREVPLPLLREVISEARLAPSAKNHQPYRVICIRNASIIEKLKKEQIPLFNSQCVLVFLGSYDLAWKNKRDEGKGSQEMDLSIFMTYVNLLLEDKGISSCIIGAFDKVAVSNILDIHDSFTPYALMTVGYASKQSEPCSPFHDHRKDIDELFTVVE